jgi:hypothetical protein
MLILARKGWKSLMLQRLVIERAAEPDNSDFLPHWRKMGHSGMSMSLTTWQVHSAAVAVVVANRMMLLGMKVVRLCETGITR